MTNNVGSYPVSGKELKRSVPARTNGGIINISPDYWFQEHFYRSQRTKKSIFCASSTPTAPPSRAIRTERHPRPVKLLRFAHWTMLDDQWHITRENRKCLLHSSDGNRVPNKMWHLLFLSLSVHVSWQHAILSQIHLATTHRKNPEVATWVIP